MFFTGQLGHIPTAGPFVTTPRVVASLNNVTVETVVCSDGATVVLTTAGELIALFEFGVNRRLFQLSQCSEMPPCRESHERPI